MSMLYALKFLVNCLRCGVRWRASTFYPDLNKFSIGIAFDFVVLFVLGSFIFLIAFWLAFFLWLLSLIEMLYKKSDWRNDKYTTMLYAYTTIQSNGSKNADTSTITVIVRRRWRRRWCWWRRRDKFGSCCWPDWQLERYHLERLA